jgi:type IV secretory pathway VirB10-like protein
VPQGARLIGKYDSVVAFGQRRALVIWQRLILPDGSSVRLDNMPATDAAGYAGLVDKVDFHTWALLKGVAIATMVGVGSELSISGESDLVEAIREGRRPDYTAQPRHPAHDHDPARRARPRAGDPRPHTGAMAQKCRELTHGRYQTRKVA